MDKELDKPKLVVFDQIVKNLKEVYDPEISVNIYDLGLIYRIDLEELPKSSCYTYINFSILSSGRPNCGRYKICSRNSRECRQL